MRHFEFLVKAKHTFYNQTKYQNLKIFFQDKEVCSQSFQSVLETLRAFETL